jgi:hypothetical protein
LQHPPGRFSSSLDATITGFHPTANPHCRVTVRWWVVVRFRAGSSELPLPKPPQRRQAHHIRSCPCHVPVPAPEGARGRGGASSPGPRRWPRIRIRLPRVVGYGGRLLEPTGKLSGRIDETTMVMPGTKAVARRGGVCHCCFGSQVFRSMWRLTPRPSAARPSRREYVSSNHYNIRAQAPQTSLRDCCMASLCRIR